MTEVNVFIEIKERQKQVTSFAKELSELFKKYNVTNYNNSEIVGFCANVFVQCSPETGVAPKVSKSRRRSKPVENSEDVITQGKIVVDNGVTVKVDNNDATTIYQ